MLLLCVQPAWAQIPDAGRSIRDLESTIPAPPPASEAPALNVPAQRAPADTPEKDAAKNSRVLVNGFLLDGNHAYDEATLQALLADLLGSEQDLNGLRAAAERLSEHYRHDGYLLARAYLPAQEIQGGLVRIRIVEGAYGQVLLNNTSRARDGVLANVLEPLLPGDAVHGRSLDQALLLLNDLPGVVATGTLRAGAEPGTTDLVVNAEPGPWIAGSIDADNFGGAYTG